MTFFEAWLVPGVILYAVTNFALKSAVGSILMWRYQVLQTGLSVPKDESPNVVTSYEIGTLIGSIALGILSDRFFSKRSPVAFIACLISAALSYVVAFSNYAIREYLVWLCFEFFIFAFFIGGLSNLVSQSCSADLAKASELTGKSNGAATIMCLIQAMG